MQWFHLPSEIAVHICSTKKTINQHTFRMTKHTDTIVGSFKKPTIKTRSTVLSAFVSHPENEEENTHFVVNGGMRCGYLKMIVQHMWTKQTRTSTTKQQVFRFTPAPSSGRCLYGKGNKRNCTAKAILLKKEPHLVLGAHKSLLYWYYSRYFDKYHILLPALIEPLLLKKCINIYTVDYSLSGMRLHDLSCYWIIHLISE